MFHVDTRCTRCYSQTDRGPCELSCPSGIRLNLVSRVCLRLVNDFATDGLRPGGLSTAAVLSQFGYKVVVFEQHEVTGGGAHCFAADGKSKWQFDAGFHITIPQHEMLLQLACGSASLPVPFDKLSEPSTGASDYVVLGEGPQGEEPLRIYDSDERLKEDLCERSAWRLPLLLLLLLLSFLLSLSTGFCIFF